MKRYLIFLILFSGLQKTNDLKSLSFDEVIKFVGSIPKEFLIAGPFGYTYYKTFKNEQFANDAKIVLGLLAAKYTCRLISYFSNLFPYFS